MEKDNLFKAALFDLDGVVFDTEPQYTVFWGSQCREFHPELPGLEYDIKGQTLKQIYERYFSGALSGKQDLITSRLARFEHNMTYDYVEGLNVFLQELKARGVKTAVVTSSSLKKMAAVTAKRPELETTFDVILTAENFDRSKPDPDCYLKGADYFHVGKENCIVFEDSFNGLKAGKSAGMAVVGLATTNPAEAIQPYSDRVISNYIGFSYQMCEDLLERKWGRG